MRALDNLSPQVHGATRKRPAYLSPDVELIVGDVRDPDAVARALDDVDAVYHLAALVGVGQSMYQIDDYVDVNARGTGVLLHTIAKKPVQRLVVASSMSVYGEGAYVDREDRPALASTRSFDQLRRGEWEPLGPTGEALAPIPTSELKPVSLESVYALTKFDQERVCLLIGRAYGIPTVALRFFNVYGPRQALSNPYTGVLAIFASRLMNDRQPLVFEDGKQRRDFVSVHDVARACALSLDASDADGAVLNIGSGRAMSVLDVASAMGAALGKKISPDVTGRYRVGDIRHCFADISLAQRVIGYAPRTSFSAGIEELAASLEGQIAHDRAQEMRAELEARGLTL